MPITQPMPYPECPGTGTRRAHPQAPHTSAAARPSPSGTSAIAGTLSFWSSTQLVVIDCSQCGHSAPQIRRTVRDGLTGSESAQPTSPTTYRTAQQRQSPSRRPAPLRPSATPVAQRLDPIPCTRRLRPRRTTPPIHARRRPPAATPRTHPSRSAETNAHTTEAHPPLHLTMRSRPPTGQAAAPRPRHRRRQPALGCTTGQLPHPHAIDPRWLLTVRSGTDRNAHLEHRQGSS
jgi:Zn ribbon nucleic-acid-binding protein